MSSYIAQFQIDSIDLLDIAFSLAPKGPKGPVRVEVKLNHDFSGIQFAEKRNRNTALVTLHVMTELQEENGTNEALMSAKAALQGSFSFGEFEDGPSNAELEEWILQNGISALYAHARSYFSFLASGSPMGRFLLPPIYVQEYLEMHKSNTKGSNSAKESD